MRIEGNNHDLNYLLNDYERKFKILALGINFKEYAQYQNILTYIPREYRIDWKGNTVLKGNFSDEQINFVYNFVVNSIIDFQNINFLERNLKTPKITDKYEFEYSYNGYKLPNDGNKLNLRGIGYTNIGSDEPTFEADINYITHESYLKFKDKFSVGQIVLQIRKQWKNKVLDHHTQRKLKIVGINFRAVRQNPGIWEYIIGYEEVPGSSKNLFDKTE